MKIFDFSINTLINFFVIQRYIGLIKLFYVYNVCFIEFKYVFRFNFTKSYQIY